MSVFFPPLSPLGDAAAIEDFFPSVVPSRRDALSLDIIPPRQAEFSPIQPKFSPQRTPHAISVDGVVRAQGTHEAAPSSPSEAHTEQTEMLAHKLKGYSIPAIHSGTPFGAAGSLAGKVASSGTLSSAAAMTAGAGFLGAYGGDMLMSVPQALAKIPAIIPDFRVPPMPQLPTGLGDVASSVGAKLGGLGDVVQQGISKTAWTGLLLLLKATSTLQQAGVDLNAVNAAKKAAKHTYTAVEKVARLGSNVEWANLEDLLTKGWYSVAAMSFYRTIAKGKRWYDPELFFYLDSKRGYIQNTDLFDKYMDFHCWKYGESVPYLEKIPKPESHTSGVMSTLEESAASLFSSARKARLVHPELSFDPASFSTASLSDPPKVHVVLEDANEPFHAPLWNATYALQWRPTAHSSASPAVTAEKDPLPVRPGGDWYLPRHQAHVFSSDTPFHFVCPPPNDVPHAFHLKVTEEASERPIGSLEFHAYQRASDPHMPAPLDFLGVADKLKRMGGSALSSVTGTNSATLHGFHELKDHYAHPLVSHF